MSEISERYRALARELTRRVDDVPVGRWDAPSPCEDWSARDVLQHLIDSHRDMPGHAGHPLVFEKSVADDPHAAWVEARDAMQTLLDDPQRAGMEYDGMFGRTSVEQTVDKFLGLDLLIHGWDIARATGQNETMPEEEVIRVSSFVESLGDNLRMGGVCGPAVTVPDDAPKQDKLLASLGRRP
ncbi:MAG: TIGR03086 family metal-binding protein [Sporichthyaceae bacterium]